MNFSSVNQLMHGGNSMDVQIKWIIFRQFIQRDSPHPQHCCREWGEPQQRRYFLLNVAVGYFAVL
jgi:hypothetical protein